MKMSPQATACIFLLFFAAASCAAAAVAPSHGVQVQVCACDVNHFYLNANHILHSEYTVKVYRHVYYRYLLQMVRLEQIQ